MNQLVAAAMRRPGPRTPLPAAPLRALAVVECVASRFGRHGRTITTRMLMVILIICVPTQAFAAEAAAAVTSRVVSAISPEARPVKLLVPFAAGGPTDTVARALAAVLAVHLHHAVVVENIAGAGGTAGTAAASRAAPDGMTLLLHHIGMATAPALYRSLPYDPRRDFEPVGRVVDVPMVLVARPGFAAANLAEAVRHIRRHQDSIVVAYAGLGSASHLCGLLLSTALEVDLIQVPYRGTGPALRDLQESQTDLMCDQTTNTGEAIRTGRVRALGVAALRRLPGMPSVPTMAEAGVRGLELSIWHGLYAPRGTPREIVDRLGQALQASLATPSFSRAMNDMQVVVATREQASAAGLSTLLAAEIARWSPILRKAGQYAD